MKILHLLPFLIFSWFYSRANNPSKETGASNDLVETLIQEFLIQAKLPGLSIAVGKGNNLLYAKGFGYSNLKQGNKMNTTTLLRAASVSKVITATALGRLVAQGKLNWEDPLGKFFPDIKKEYAPLTIRQLCGHTSGIVHRPKGKNYRTNDFTTLKEINRLTENSLLFAPDTEYQYSTIAFNFLAAVIEKVTNLPFEKFMSEEIFTPLKMTQTSPDKKHLRTTQDAKLYYFKKGKIRKDRYTSPNYKLPGAGFKSTPSDLIQLMQAYHNGFITPEVVQQMFHPNQLNNGTSTQVGMGWRSSIDAFGHKVMEHAGNWRGARSVVVYYPEEEISISIMINAQCPVFIEETAHLLAELFRDKNEETNLSKGFVQKVLVTDRHEGSNDKVYPGEIQWSGEKGHLKTNSEGFLRFNKLFSLGKMDHFALVTKHGLFYLQWSQKGPSLGRLYLYQSRLLKSCIDGNPNFELIRRE